MTLKCPICDLPLKYAGYTSTCVAFFTLNGHDHNNNSISHTIKCANNHRFSYSLTNRCRTDPGCNWMGKVGTIAVDPRISNSLKGLYCETTKKVLDA